MKSKIVLIISLLTSLIIQIALVDLILNRHFGSSNKFQIVNEELFNLKETDTKLKFSNSDEEFFTSYLNEIKDNSEDNITIETAIKIREKILDSKIVDQFRYSQHSLQRNILPGENFLCSDYSLLYGSILKTYGFSVRVTYVTKSIFNSVDSHTFIEIYDEQCKRWIISDPTYNISFKKEGRYLSSNELYELIQSGESCSIETIRGKKTINQVDFKESYFIYFDNVVLIPTINRSLISRFNPFKKYNHTYTNKLLSTVRHPVNGNEIAIQNLIFYFLYLINPIVIFILFFKVLISKVLTKLFHTYF